MRGSGITLDDRVGSRHYAQYLPGATVERMEFGDAAWMGAGGALVGVEIKKVLDAVNCLYSGRLADHQIPGMRDSYDTSYLLIEGVYRSDPESGVLQLWREFPTKKDVQCGRWQDATSGRKRLMYSAFTAWLATLESYGGVKLRTSDSPSTTADLLLSLYNWHQREDHKSFEVMHQSNGDGATLSRPTMLRRMLAHLPHVGWDRSTELLQRIGRVQFYRKDGKPMKPGDWYIEGQIAAKSADDIERACDGENSYNNR